jgi:hypothetical protein
MRRDRPLADQDSARMIRNPNLFGWVDLEPSNALPLPNAILADEFEMVEA